MPDTVPTRHAIIVLISRTGSMRGILLSSPMCFSSLACQHPPGFVACMSQIARGRTATWTAAPGGAAQPLTSSHCSHYACDRVAFLGHTCHQGHRPCGSLHPHEDHVKTLLEGGLIIDALELITCRVVRQRVGGAGIMHIAQFQKDFGGGALL